MSIDLLTLFKDLVKYTVALAPVTSLLNQLNLHRLYIPLFSYRTIISCDKIIEIY